MVVFTYTLPVDEPMDRPTIELDELWDSLVSKASNPVPFVPAITQSNVLERFDGGFLREIVLRDTARYRERVLFEPKRRILFEQLDDPVLSLVTNEIDVDQAGRLRFTFAAALSPAGVERSRTDSGFIASSELIFYDTAQAELSALRLTVALTRCGGA